MKQFIVILGLFLLTALQCLSQTRYIIENDTVIAYNAYEQQQIALMLVEGDEYRELCLNKDALISTQDSVIDNLRYKIVISDSTIQIQYTKLKYLSDKNHEYQRALKRQERATKTLAWTSGGLGAIVLLLILL